MASRLDDERLDRKVRAIGISGAPRGAVPSSSRASGAQHDTGVGRSRCNSVIEEAVASAVPEIVALELCRYDVAVEIPERAVVDGEVNEVRLHR